VQAEEQEVRWQWHLVRSSCRSDVQAAATCSIPASVTDLHPLRLSKVKCEPLLPSAAVVCKLTLRFQYSESASRSGHAVMKRPMAASVSLQQV